MKILIIEYITGGGLVKQALPTSLVHQGEMMFTALVEDLLAVDGMELMVTRDYRLPLSTAITESLNVIKITPKHTFENQLIRLFEQCDAVWPIAPETDNILFDLCRLISLAPVRLLASSAATIRLASDKLETYLQLTKHAIKTVETHRLKGFKGVDKTPEQIWVIKPVDGVACKGVMYLKQTQLSVFNSCDPRLLIQPYIKGGTLSLSCLFAAGQGWLICVNEQLVHQHNNQFVLDACRVNITITRPPYAKLVADIAQAIPELWGYIGIDVIETDTSPVVLEINPRLTTSYAGIKSALGINVAANVLALVNNTDPALKNTCNKSELINIAHAYEN